MPDKRGRTLGSSTLDDSGKNPVDTEKRGAWPFGDPDKKEVIPPAKIERVVTPEDMGVVRVPDVDAVETDAAGNIVPRIEKRLRGITVGVIVMFIAVLGLGIPSVVNLVSTLSSEPVDLRRSVLKLDLFDKQSRSLGSGSCFIVAEKDGWYYAVTAKHCVEYYPDRWIKEPVPVPMLWADFTHKVEVLRKDPDADVALIRFKSEDKYMPLSLADPEVGEACTTVGWAGGTFLQFQGHVAGFDFKCADDERYTVANSGLYPGCSGGVLLNSENEVIGVTVAAPLTRNGLWDTVGLYVPIKYVRALMETI